MSTGPYRNYTTYRKKRYGLYRCKCRKCWGRKSLPKLPAFYPQQPKCGCGARDWWVDWSRTAKLDPTTSTTCKCDHLHYPHHPRTCGTVKTTRWG